MKRISIVCTFIFVFGIGSQVHALSSIERMQEQAKQYRHARRQLAVSASNPTMLSRLSAYVTPTAGMLAGGAAIGYMGATLPRLIEQSMQASRASKAAAARASSNRYEAIYNDDGEYQGYYDSETDAFYEEPMPEEASAPGNKQEEPQESATVTLPPGTEYAAIGGGVAAGYGMYRLAAWLHNRWRQKQQRAQLHKTIAMLSQYKNHLPEQTRAIMQRLHAVLATSGTMNASMHHIKPVAQLAVDDLLRREKELGDRIAAHKEQQKQRGVR